MVRYNLTPKNASESFNFTASVHETELEFQWKKRGAGGNFFNLDFFV
jgi:hypothetical protein